MKALLAGLLMLLSSCATLGGGGSAPDASEPPTSPPALIRFEGPVDVPSATSFLGAMATIEAAVVRPPFVLIEINSPGGEVDAGFAIAKAIERSPIPVICVVDGQAASMMFYILQSCTVRAATPRAELMMHGVTLIGAVRASNVSVLAKRIDVSNKAMIAQVAARMKITKEDIAAKISAGDWWMDAEEALEVGAIDTIIPVSMLP